MGRNLSFQNKAALQKAMNLFWVKGYENCSLNELLAVMEIGNGSFYHSFGSKKNVFLKTLELYFNDASERVRDIMKSDCTIQEKIRALFADAIDRQMDPQCPKGCFIVNTVSADAIDDVEIKQRVRYYLDTFETTLEVILSGAIGRGELDARIDARNAAVVINFYLQGLMKLSLLEYPVARLQLQTDYFLKSMGF